MTETDTRDVLSLAFAAVAVLVPIALLGAIAVVGSFSTPHGLAILMFAIPAVLLGAVLAVGAGLTRRSVS
jgi:hypothetical protein